MRALGLFDVKLTFSGTSGLGRQAILTLSAYGNPSHIYFTGRNVENAKDLIEEVGSDKATFLECDHTSLESVRAVAHQLLSHTDRLDVLVSNAGVMAIPPRLTKDEYEIQFGINHLSHALFIKLLLPLLERTAKEQGEARMVSVASLAAAHTAPGGIAFDGLRTTQDDLGMTAKWIRYGQSKLANILYTWELAKRYPWLTTASLEPGTVWTGLLSNLGFLDRMFLRLLTWWKSYSLEEGAYNACWAATAEKSKIESGRFYTPVGVRAAAMAYTEDEALAKKLWDWTQEQLKDYD